MRLKTSKSIHMSIGWVLFPIVPRTWAAHQNLLAAFIIILT